MDNSLDEFAFFSFFSVFCSFFLKFSILTKILVSTHTNLLCYTQNFGPKPNFRARRAPIWVIFS